jgi:hypothetical protein
LEVHQMGGAQDVHSRGTYGEGGGLAQDEHSRGVQGGGHMMCNVEEHIVERGIGATQDEHVGTIWWEGAEYVPGR